MVAANANYRFGELDLVMRDGPTLVFVEVRYRADDRFGGGAQSITSTASFAVCATYSRLEGEWTSAWSKPPLP